MAVLHRRAPAAKPCTAAQPLPASTPPPTARARPQAGAIQFEAVFRGRGGHAAIPHLTRDPVVAAAAAVGALQALVSRETSPFASAVVSVTRMSAGDAFNVIPDEGGWAGGWAERAL